MASSILFAHARATQFSTNRPLGNADYLDDERPFDHEMLGRFWSAFKRGDLAHSRLLVFHSYAGHGEYAENIPPSYRQPIDGLFAGLPAKAVLGASQTSRLSAVESYDSAMRYVSDNIARSIAEIDRASDPMVLVFFSDHGDSILTGQSHDAVRYIWAMGAVPFVIHFNPSARERYPELVERYAARAEKSEPASLANLPSLVFDLLGIEVSAPGTDLHPVSECGFATGECLPRFNLVGRAIDGGLSAVRMPGNFGTSSDLVTDATDRDTAHHNLMQALASRPNPPSVCFHRSNSLASILRARAISPCIELDVVIESGQAIVAHDPGPAVRLELDRALTALGRRPSQIWLDAKNIDDPANCAVLAGKLRQRGYAPHSLFVEFGSRSAANMPALDQCMEALAKTGAALSFYVPDDQGVPCAEELQAGKRGAACRTLDATLAAALQPGRFTDISFDFAGYRAIRANRRVQAIRWNTWYIEDDDIMRLPPGKFRLVIPRRVDPNYL